MPTSLPFQPPKGDSSCLDPVPGRAAGPRTPTSHRPTPDLSVNIQGPQRAVNPAWEAAPPALAKDHLANTPGMPRTLPAAAPSALALLRSPAGSRSPQDPCPWVRGGAEDRIHREEAGHQGVRQPGLETCGQCRRARPEALTWREDGKAYHPPVTEGRRFVI